MDGGWVSISAAWFVGTFGGGWLLARLYKHLYPQLSFYKLWAFWSMLLGGMVALMLILRVVRL
jgi:hypothetical protein